MGDNFKVGNNKPQFPPKEPEERESKHKERTAYITWQTIRISQYRGVRDCEALFT